MEYNNMPRTSEELTHWGIKGMKWGVRRYQNKDGSLTAAGKKRVAAEKNELKERERVIKNREKVKAERAKLDAKKNELDARERDLDGEAARKSKSGSKQNENDSTTSTRTKSISEMSNKELQEYTTRMQLEKNYLDAQRQLAASMPPKQVSKGQKFAEQILNEAILPAAKNAGRAYLEKMMKEKMGINTEDPVSALETTWKKLDYEQKIDKIKNPDKYLSEEDKNKRQHRDFDAEDRAAKMEGYQNAADKAAKQRQEQETARKAAADEAARAANSAKSEEYYNSSYSKPGSGPEYVNPNANRGMSAPVSSVPAPIVSSGKNRVDTLLDRYGNEMIDVYYSEDDD